VQGGLTEGERTLREDWPVVDGSWRCTGLEELPCELVRECGIFLGSGVPVKQLRSQRKEMGVAGGGQDGMGESGRARSVPGEDHDLRTAWAKSLQDPISTGKAGRLEGLFQLLQEV
jgi:hypothetical protein